MKERFAFMIPIHNQDVAVKHRRAAFAVSVERLHLTQLPFPLHRAVCIKAEQPAGSKKSVDKFTVRGRRIRRGTSGFVSALVRPFMANVGFP